MKLTLKSMLQYFLDFRMEVLTRRLEYQLDVVRKRIHILEGFERIFDELDEAIRIIRASDGKQDAANQLMARFFLDEIQVEAILETKLYRLAKLEINAIREELAELRAEEERLFNLLSDSALRWNTIRGELLEIKAGFATPRRSKVDAPAQVLTFDPNAYIVTEDAVVIVTRDGWIKRQKSFSEVGSIRVREGDSVGWVIHTNTRHTVAFFTNLGSAYVLRVDELPSTTGYGEPVQRHFEFGDRERVVGVICFDPRCLPTPVAPPAGAHAVAETPEPLETAGLEEESQDPGVLAVAITRGGKGLRFPIEAHRERSTRAGRRVIRLDDTLKDDAVLLVQATSGAENLSLVTEARRAMVFPVSDLNILRGAGKGVTAIKLQDDDRVAAVLLAHNDTEGLTVETNRGRVVVINANTYEPSHRGGRGNEISKTGTIKIAPPSPMIIGVRDGE
jgi:DNA gyrase subunit A